MNLGKANEAIPKDCLLGNSSSLKGTSGYRLRSGLKLLFRCRSLYLVFHIPHFHDHKLSKRLLIRVVFTGDRPAIPTFTKTGRSQI
jgi:hypothetical protein